MRFFLLTLLVGILVICASALAPQKAILVTYPNDTPGSVIDEAKKTIEEAV